MHAGDEVRHHEPVREIAIDYPDEVVHWMPDYPEAERKRPVTGACPHECRHRIFKLAGWGPDYDHYVLYYCDDDGCQGNCRGWAPLTGDRADTRRMTLKLLGSASG